MSLFALMFHHGRAGRHGNAADMLDLHFAYVARHCACVLPGEPLQRTRPNVCLTFDDGYRDFHQVVYPLLREHGLRAMLAVPAGEIAERRTGGGDAEARSDGLRDLCTWSELKEMADSGHVQIAAHGFTHRPLDEEQADLHTEIVVPKTLIAGWIAREVNSFVFPYGRFSPTALQHARRHYRYVFRIGSADNRDWQGSVLYRIDADRMTSPGALFERHRRSVYALRRRWNQLRGR